MTDGANEIDFGMAYDYKSNGEVDFYYDFGVVSNRKWVVNSGNSITIKDSIRTDEVWKNVELSLKDKLMDADINIGCNKYETSFQQMTMNEFMSIKSGSSLSYGTTDTQTTSYIAASEQKTDIFILAYLLSA